MKNHFFNKCNCTGLSGPGSTILDISADTMPVSEWGCVEWMTWHKRLVVKHGTELANEIFQSEWDKQGIFDPELNFCRYNNDFVNYFLSKGLDVRSFISAIFTNVTEVVAGGTDDIRETVEEVGGALVTTGDVISDVATGAENTSSALKWLLPVGLGITVVVGGIVLHRNASLILPKLKLKAKPR